MLGERLGSDSNGALCFALGDLANRITEPCGNHPVQQDEHNDEERSAASDEGLDLDEVISTNDLVSSENVFFAATGVTGGEYLRAVEFRGDQVVTHSVIMRSKTGSIRDMTAYHDLARLRAISAQTLD